MDKTEDPIQLVEVQSNMKGNKKFFITMLALVGVILAACGKTTDGTASSSDNLPSNNDSTQTEESDSSSNEDTATEPNDKEDTSNSLKDEYLVKLNEMDKKDREVPADTSKASTTVELEKEEAERLDRWDEALNEIYSVLNEQLSAEEMEQLREEQRDWIKERDQKAKEASLKYEGGTMEGLEYVATQASVTKDRCYELVAKYM